MRQLALLKNYGKRKSFGKRLIDLPLFKEILESLEKILKKCFKFTFHAVELLGRSEQENEKEAEKQLELITPLLKLYTAKKNIAFSSEILECFGGVGYLEDSGIPKFLRDAQVLSIWEGTTNVLSLDFLRALRKEGIDCLRPLIDDDEINELKSRENLFSEGKSRQLSFEISEKYV